MTLERGLMRPKVARNLKVPDLTGIKFQHHPPTHFKHQPHLMHAVPDSENQPQSYMTLLPIMIGYMQDILFCPLNSSIIDNNIEDAVKLKDIS